MEIGRFVLFQTVDKVTVDSLFKMLIINIVFGINSMRKTCQEIEANLETPKVAPKIDPKIDPKNNDPN